ncbi:uncharacterized protein LOC106052744 [Biomphalaria glabrata]|uniref:Uncharacterized protein LOC106052744 n=1 Tax=Biomphalaria glabrata TaxID=6526 RepID=A0A2C9LK85_BIOGL|nr:uncharacterized protein LOC106052744 [Biomphalaria glabrata]KAI8730894.1 hypothetical protein BgiMline_030519 [Biomphalaria glabrata]KAI8782115.1 hypothetical protein BgiBS90_017511 [Biomphalaria glabrata]
MLEDLEDKRSVNSYHSFHSLRLSRSHHGPRNFGDELSSRYESHFLRTTSASGHTHSLVPGFRGTGRSNSARYYSTSPSITYPNLQLKSHSYENVPLVSHQGYTMDIPANLIGPITPPRKSKTLSHSDISQQSETAI